MTDTIRSRVEAAVARHRGSKSRLVHLVLDEIESALPHPMPGRRAAWRETQRSHVEGQRAGVLDAVHRLRFDLGRTPTQVEISMWTGVPASTVHKRVHELIDAGELTMDRGRILRVVAQRKTGT